MAGIKNALGKKLANHEIYKDRDFKTAGERIERLCMYILEPGRGSRLSSQELVYLDRLGDAYTFLMNSPNKLEAGRKLMQKYKAEVTRIGKAMEIITDAELVYGKVLFNNHDFEKQKIVSKAWAIYEQCVEKEEFYTANFILRTIADVQGVGKEKELEDYFESLKLPTPRFSDDPAILQLGDAEEAQYDEEE